MIKEQVFLDSVMELYPQGVYLGSIVNDEENKSATLHSVIPKVLFNDKLNVRLVKFIKINDIGKITINKDNKIVHFTKPDSIRIRISEGIVDIQSKTEQIVLASIYDKLASIAMVRTTLNPIYNILKSVYEQKLTKASLKNYPKKEKYLKYIHFLCELDILREQTDRYSEGNYFIQLEKALEKKDDEEIVNKVFGLTIKEGKTYLINNLNINVLKPFIRIANTYYLSSIMFKDIIYVKRENLYYKYLSMYDLNTSFVNFSSYIDQLSRANIIHEEEYVYGSKSVFSDVMTAINKTNLRYSVN